MAKKDIITRSVDEQLRKYLPYNAGGGISSK